MARKPAEGGTEHDGRRCNEQRCQSAKKKGPFFQPKRAPAARVKIQDKLNKPSHQASDEFQICWKGLEDLST